LINQTKWKLPGGEFIRNVLTLMTGTTIAQAIPVLVTPILTRMYSPGDFGVAALFLSITTIFGVIANGRYELAIVLPVEDEDAINITALSILISASLSIFLLPIVVIFNNQIAVLLNSQEIRPWLYLAPLAIFLTGLFNALSYFNVRIKKFKKIATANVYKSVVQATVRLGLGLLKTGSAGLISGQILSNLTGNSTLALDLIKNKKLLSKINRTDIKRLAKRYIDFPKFSTWSALANTLSYNLTNIFISTVYSASTLGLYSMGNTAIGMPSSLVGNAVGQVFFEKANEERNRTGCAVHTFNSTFRGLMLIAVPTFVVLYFIVEDLFAFVFGDEWRVAGQYAKIMLPLFFARFVTAPISTTNIVFEKQKIGLIWQTSLLLTTLVVFLFSYRMNFDIVKFLHLFSYASFLLYFIMYLIILKISKGNK
jgi:O-antigen/teichoic acid export membrane protein